MDDNHGQGGAYEIVDGVRRLIERTAPDSAPAADAEKPNRARRAPPPNEPNPTPGGTSEEG